MGRRGNQARPLKVELSFQVRGIGKTKGGGILTPDPPVTDCWYILEGKHCLFCADAEIKKEGRDEGLDPLIT